MKELTDFKIEGIINNDEWKNGTPQRQMDHLVRVFRLGMAQEESEEVKRLKSENNRIVNLYKAEMYETRDLKSQLTEAIEIFKSVMRTRNYFKKDGYNEFLDRVKAFLNAHHQGEGSD